MACAHGHSPDSPWSLSPGRFGGTDILEYRSNNSEVETIVVSAGAATATGADDGHNSCHLVDLQHFRIHVRRPLLDNGEFQSIKAAQSFEFEQKLALTLDDETIGKVPLSTSVLKSSLEGESATLTALIHITTLRPRRSSTRTATTSPKCFWRE